MTRLVVKNVGQIKQVDSKDYQLLFLVRKRIAHYTGC